MSEDRLEKEGTNVNEIENQQKKKLLLSNNGSLAWFASMNCIEIFNSHISVKFDVNWIMFDPLLFVLSYWVTAGEQEPEQQCIGK